MIGLLCGSTIVSLLSATMVDLQAWQAWEHLIRGFGAVVGTPQLEPRGAKLGCDRGVVACSCVPCFAQVEQIRRVCRRLCASVPQVAPSWWRSAASSPAQECSRSKPISNPRRPGAPPRGAGSLARRALMRMETDRLQQQVRSRELGYFGRILEHHDRWERLARHWKLAGRARGTSSTEA